ncbi:hypothetical protein Airi02_016910 [Actinoallomurus iriomotensis]|nr:hypothetical protein Airi02_016910 [Actinoallomurus iriomotensis]
MGPHGLLDLMHHMPMAHPAQQYYNPDLTEEEERALLRRNYLLLQAGQAALGLISADMLALAVEPRPDAVVIHVAVSRETPELAEDIDDIVSDLKAFLSGGPDQNSTITARVHLGPPDATWPGSTQALLYVAKPA